jgi:hypothetical protein
VGNQGLTPTKENTMQPYRTDTIEKHGKTYRIEWFFDADHGAPWQECDGHGFVTEFERRSKRPGELILCDSRGSKRFYDFQASIERAKAEGWNTAPYDWPTKGAQAHAAVMADYEYLRRWCNDQWHYCGIVVTLMDDDEETDISDSLWGIEDDGDSDGYHTEVIDELIRGCEYQENHATIE